MLTHADVAGTETKEQGAQPGDPEKKQEGKAAEAREAEQKEVSTYVYTRV